jgi:hypothetical protein
MNGESLRRAIEDARACALSMMDNAALIETELPEIGMSAALETRTREVCDELVGAKHDVFAELAELERLRDEGPVPDEIVRASFERVIGWLQAPLEPMHELARALEAQPHGGAAWTLVADAATHVYEAFGRARESAQRLWGEGPGP